MMAVRALASEASKSFTSRSSVPVLTTRVSSPAPQSSPPASPGGGGAAGLGAGAPAGARRAVAAAVGGARRGHRALGRRLETTERVVACRLPVERHGCPAGCAGGSEGGDGQQCQEDECRPPRRPGRGVPHGEGLSGGRSAPSFGQAASAFRTTLTSAEGAGFPRYHLSMVEPRVLPIPTGLQAPGTAASPFEAVASFDELPPGTLLRITRGDLDVLLAHTEAGLLATDDRCPHMSAPLSQGVLEGTSRSPRVMRSRG